MNWINKNLANFGIVSISCIFGIFCVELALRIINSSDPWGETYYANVLRDIKFTYDVGPLYESDVSSVEYVRNEYGLRDSCGSTSEIDILTVGGSTTDQRYVPTASTYQAIIEKRLKSLVDGFGCVTNAGIDGHSTWGHLFSFKHWFPLIPDLKPKIVVLYIGVNDANFLRATSPNPGDDLNSAGGMKVYLKNFELVKALLPIYRLMRQSKTNESAVYGGHLSRAYTVDDYIINAKNPRTDTLSEKNKISFQQRMESLLKSIDSLGATPLCVTQPHRYVIEKDGMIWGVKNVLGEGFSGVDYDYSIRQLNDVIKRLCGKNTVDLYNHKFADIHFYDGVHTTAAGSEQIGEVIAEFIINRRRLFGF